MDFMKTVCTYLQVPVAARSEAWVCARSSAEIVGSNPTGGMDACCECCVMLGRGLCDALIASRGVLPTVVRRCLCVCDLETS